MSEKANSFEQQITESVAEYFFIYQLSTKSILYLSDSSKHYFYGEEISDYDKMRDLIHDDFKVAFDQVFEKINDGNMEQNTNLRYHDKAGEEKWINIQTFPIKHNGIDHVAGQIFDNTDDIIKLQELNEQADDMQFIINTMVHDIRNPLSSIKHFTQIIDIALEKGEHKKIRGYNNVIKRLTVNVTDLLGNISQLVQANSRKMELVREVMDLSLLTGEIIEDHRPVAELKQITVEYVAPDTSLEAPIDELKIQLVLSNLLHNAIKFSPKDGQITVTLEKDGDNAVWSVSDSGIGIPENKQVQIFEIFTPFMREGTAGERASGVGLSIAKKMTEMHDGKIAVESHEGEGSKFIVTIPLNKETSGQQVADDATKNVV